MYLYPLTLNPPSHLPPYPTALGCHRAPALGSLHHTADPHWLAGNLYSNSNVYVPILPSQAIPPPPSPPVTLSLFFMSVSPLMP